MDDSRRCTATSKRSGERCGRAAAVGATVCVMHGAGAPQVARVAQLRVVEAEAVAVADRLDVRSPPGTDPAVVLLAEVDRIAAVVGWIAEQIAQVDAGTDRHAALLATLGSWSDRAVKVSTEVGRLGLAARRVEIREEHTRLYATAFGRAISHLWLSEEQKSGIVHRFFAEVRALVDSTPDAVMVEAGEDG